MPIVLVPRSAVQTYAGNASGGILGLPGSILVQVSARQTAPPSRLKMG
jgi:hypothetical protein